MKHGFLAGIVAGALAVGVPMPAVGQAAGGGTGQKPAADRAKSSSGSLGTVRITRAVTANGERLSAGTYTVRLTDQEVKPAPGQSASLSRWVEFVQGGQVRGREVASVVPESEIAQIAQDRRVPAGRSRVEMLKGNEYLRIWINRSGTNYLIHLPPA